MNSRNDFFQRYGACLRKLGHERMAKLLAAQPAECAPHSFPAFLLTQSESHQLPPYLAQLAELELAYHRVRFAAEPLPGTVEQLTLNPSLELLQLSWRHLVPLLFPSRQTPRLAPQAGEEQVLIWRDPRSRRTRVRVAEQSDLAVIKMMLEGISPEDAAREGQLSLGLVDGLFTKAAAEGLILTPPSMLRRPGGLAPAGATRDERFLTARVFTLQWHITQQCDLHCKHCYDRSKRSALDLEQGRAILDQLRAFCLARHVQGHVSFTGGNPLLHPQFFDFYRVATEQGLSLAILGNPTSRARLAELVAIKTPAFYQVSLEGLPEHNDEIRGPGHFARVMQFLDLLAEFKIHSLVMLTLTDRNIDQILPLTELLRGRADDFTFNRLSLVGEGAALALPSPERYRDFLHEYNRAARDNPLLGLKDGLLNIVRQREGERLFGGCCGFGCGAAFNFLCALPDGEVHACRKFPSHLGNILQQSLAEIYDSAAAARYRAGSRACAGCQLRAVCGGCLAITQSFGLDFSAARDPFCFVDEQ